MKFFKQISPSLLNERVFPSDLGEKLQQHNELKERVYYCETPYYNSQHNVEKLSEVRPIFFSGVNYVQKERHRYYNALNLNVSQKLSPN